MDVSVLIACLALVGTLLIVFLLLCRLIQPYDIAWFLSNREDKIKLSKMKLYNANGYLMHSGSQILLGSTGSFQRFDSVDRDYKPQYGQGLGVPAWRTASIEESEIPPQPLRPAPSPKEPKLVREKAIQKQTSEPKPATGGITISPIPRPVPRKQHSAPISFPLPMLNSPREKRFQNESHICTNPFLNQTPLHEESDPLPPPPPPALTHPPVPPMAIPDPQPETPFLRRLIRSANNPFISDSHKSGEECFFSFEPITVRSIFAEDDPLRRAEKRISKMENLRKMSRLIESNQVLLNIYQQFNSNVDRSSESDQTSIPPPSPLFPSTDSPQPTYIAGHSSSSSTSPLVSPKFMDSSAKPSPRPPTAPQTVSPPVNRTDNSKYKDSPRTEAGDNIRIPTVSNSIKHILRNRSFSETEFSERTLFKSYALVSESDHTNPFAYSIPRKNSSYKDLERFCSGSPQPPVGSSSSSLQKTLSESFLEQYSLGRAENERGLPMAQFVGSTDRMRSVMPSTSSESVASQSSVVFSDLEPAQPITGYLCVGLQYDKTTTTMEGTELLITIQEAKQLVGQPGIEMDTFVKVFIVPDESKVLQTKIFKSSNSPSYQETFNFWIPHNNIRRSLWFHLYQTSTQEQILIGECELQINENINRPMTTWLKLQDSSLRKSQLGDLMFSLSYLPTAERLTVVVVKARNLNLKNRVNRLKQQSPLISFDDAPDSTSDEPGEVNSSEGIFVKVYLLKNDKKVSKKKTSVKRGERSPIYNEAIIFSVPPYMLSTIQIRCSVVQMANRDCNNPTHPLATYDNSSNTPTMNGNNNSCGSINRRQSVKLVSIGHVIVGSGTTGKGLRHWHQMLTTLRKPVTMWHALKTTSERQRKRLGEPEQESE
ncbi:uncharacterized protein LOC131692702 [Topomyia yanbarensis]|uniref:uncharacterized protein LOC131692702 n=1 Tax=Topomyia yanbarensis TaxID=2498891 RepID=UPI00273B166C|nr:uncharacterized protein LOC131692702 [Topomyia yanbarensis]